MRCCNDETMLPVPFEVNPSCLRACTSECWNACSSCPCPGVCVGLAVPPATVDPADAAWGAAVAPAPVTAEVDGEPIACSNDCTSPLNKAVEAPTGNCPMLLLLLLVVELLEVLLEGACAPLLWPWPGKLGLVSSP